MNKADHNNSGFSLLEMALVIVIISILLGMIISTSKARIDAVKIYETKQKMEIIEAAIDKYVAQYGHLPCPSSLKIATSDVNSGLSTVPTTNTCSTVDALSAGPIYVLGAVPIITLGLNAKDDLDAWDMHFDFIITQDYVSTANYINSASNFGNSYTIRTRGGGANVAAGQNIAYILISHGENRYGGFNDQGVKYRYRYDDPTATPPIVGQDSPNADEIENSNLNATFIQATPNVGFDDIMLIKKVTDLPKYINQ